MRALSDVSMTVLIHMWVVNECDRIRNCFVWLRLCTSTVVY